uniref:Uncharacterized protein n=1 Tax=Picea glauca TaxID=3330 RepID=A0A101LWH5_PICGL|nr:hypothetical protein ABT39_MTgene1722 [Picea glauca]KUM47212.1 hypothetical protein ABT39_MTgene6218 [Picea glauca]KUM49733.1 hypothetical protein ABT39_MTgene2960 [Picea glauca]QHR87356.1 hypothetical protein Q903MT_gene1366 [Picea sitchensis]
MALRLLLPISWNLRQWLEQAALFYYLLPNITLFYTYWTNPPFTQFISFYPQLKSEASFHSSLSFTLQHALRNDSCQKACFPGSNSHRCT